MSFASYIYKAGLLRSNHILFSPGVTNGEDLVFKYEVFLLASQIAYSGEKLYIYRRNSDQVTSNYSRDAKEHYRVLLKGWEALEKFSKKEFLNHQEDTRKLGEYAQRKVLCTCIFASRSFCIWGNGSYKAFKCFLEDFVFPNINKGLIPCDEDVLLDYDLLLKYPFVFFIKYSRMRYIEAMKKIIRRIKYNLRD